MAPGCQIWWAEVADARPELAELLPPAELQRMGRYRRQADRDRILTAWVLARVVVGGILGVTPANVRVDRTCRRCGAAHGKPQVTGVELSVSHAGERVVVAVSPSQALGVDVERIARFDDGLSQGLVATVLTSREQEELRGSVGGEDPQGFLRYWVRKEAVVKATGDGLLLPLRTFAVSAPAAPARVLSSPANPAVPADLTLRDIPCATGYVAALAVIGPAGPIEERDGSALLASLA